MRPAPDPAEVRLKSLALPAEHGAWGLLAEPVLVGLLLAPSLAGLCAALGAACAFLARHPLKLALSDLVKRRVAPRTAAAWRIAALYAASACLFFALGLGREGEADWWWALAAAAPFGLAQLAHDVLGRARSLLPELLGGAALGSVAAALLRAGGWSWAASLAAWAILVLKAVAAVLYVRARLRADRGVPFSRASVLAAHALALAAAAALAWASHAPWLAVVAFAVLLARAVRGLSARHERVPPKAIGYGELRFGLGFVALVCAGYWLGV